MKIEVLYPEIANLYGDLMNVEFLRQSGAEVVNTGLKQTPKFISEKIDLVYMGAMTERSQEIAVRALMPYASQLRLAVGRGVVFFVTGNALEVFGKEIQNEDGSAIECLGLFDGVAKRDMMNRYNSIYLGKFGDMDIVGYKSQFSHMYGAEDCRSVFETVRGDGRHPGCEGEGVMVGNFIGTYLIGPFLVINPPFAKYLMHLAGEENPRLAFEEKAMEVYGKRVKEFKDPKTRVSF